MSCMSLRHPQNSIRSGTRLQNSCPFEQFPSELGQIVSEPCIQSNDRRQDKVHFP